MAIKVKKKKSKDKEKVKTPNFLKSGKEKKALMKAEKRKEQMREEQRDKLWRFRIPEDQIDEEFEITFLDGNLDSEGLIESPVYYEHSVKYNGKWVNFVSCKEDEEDPLEEQGQEPYLAQAFTVINHTPYEASNGKVYKNRKMLLVAKRNSMKQLQKIATKRGGLAGCTFEVSRSNNKAAAIGDMYNFVEKISDEKLRKKLIKAGVKKKEVDELMAPANYRKELTYYSAKQLQKMGLAEERKTLSTKDYDDDEDDVDDEL